MTSTLKETPAKFILHDLLNDISDKWYDIGLALQVHRSILDYLSCSQDSNVDKLLKVIKNILDTQPSTVTWETVITAIESPTVNNKARADEIRQYLSVGKINKLFFIK